MARREAMSARAQAAPAGGRPARPRRPGSRATLLARLQEANQNLVLANLRAQTLAETAQHLAAIVESSNDGVIGVALDGEIVSWNRECERLFGYSAEEARGATLALLDPDGLPGALREVLERLVEGEPVSRLETVLRHRDGRHIHVATTVSPIMSGDRLSGASIAARDITAFQRAQDALRRSEALFRHLADAMPQFVWAAGPDGRIDYFNRGWYAFTGLTPDHEPMPWTSLVHGEDTAALVAYEASIASGQPFQADFRLFDRSSGEYRWFLGRAVPIRDDGGDVIRWFGTCTDVDGMKRIEVQLERTLELEQRAREEAEAAGRAKDILLATVSHELRTPLNAVLGWARLLGDGRLNAEQGRHAVHAIESQATSLARLIDDLLDVSRGARGALTVERAPLDMTGVIEGALDQIRLVAEQKDVAIGFRSEGPAAVDGDAERLRQVVGNLLTNAVKFTPAGGRVQVDLRSAGVWVEVSVTDSGEGIGPELLPFVFDLFRQADGSTTRRHGGLGLGLSIVRTLVELHGGSVEAASSGQGRGTTFTVRIPRRADPDVVPERAQT